MAHARYQQTAQFGNVRVPIERSENWAEDWTWRTVKLVGFFIGSFAVLFWIFQFGSWFGGRSTPPTTSTSSTPVVVTTPISEGRGGGTGRPTPPTPPVIKVEVVKKVEVVTPPPPPIIVPTPFGKLGLPPNQW